MMNMITKISLSGTVIFVLVCFFVGGDAYGANYLDRVAVVERVDGGISITRFAVEDMQRYGYSDEDTFIAWYMDRVSPGSPFTVIAESALPKQVDGSWDRTQRDYWSFVGGRVQPDPQKINAKQVKDSARQAVFTKLGITESEFKLIRRSGGNQ